jgi:hypothetical protein|tara:strand:+ start:437 stop:988 length:552 start_codon:yes stop_codon:yes gene_type:complete
MILGSPTYIATHTASSATSIEITSNIDSTYDTYMLVMTDMKPESTVGQKFGFNTDHAGTSYNNPHCSTNIMWSYNDDDSGADFSQGAGVLSDNSTTPVEMGHGVGNTSYAIQPGIFYIFDPSTATTETQYMWHITGYYATGDGTFGCWNNAKENGAGTISKIKFTAAGGSALFSGTIDMYGVS